MRNLRKKTINRLGCIMMVIQNKYELGQIVYLVTDEDQSPRMVTQIKIGADGGLIYQLSMGCDHTEHFELEISDTVNVETK